MGVNRRRASAREGSVYLDGNKVLGAVKFELLYTPEVSETRSLGERGVSRRWLSRDITGTISQYKSTPWLREAVKKYEASGETPEFTIQGISEDTNSDYYDNYGTDTITAVGCVLTGDIPLASLDSEGDLIMEEIEFGAHAIV